MKEYILECLCTMGIIFLPVAAWVVTELILKVILYLEYKYEAYVGFKAYCEEQRKKKESFRKMIRYDG